MDPEPDEAADLGAGGDNMFSLSTTSSSYPAASSKPSQDDNDIVIDEEDSFEKVNINNSNTASDVTGGFILDDQAEESNLVDMEMADKEPTSDPYEEKPVEDLSHIAAENLEDSSEVPSLNDLGEDEMVMAGYTDVGGTEDAEKDGVEEMDGFEYTEVGEAEEAETGGAEYAEIGGDEYTETGVAEYTEMEEDEDIETFKPESTELGEAEDAEMGVANDAQLEDAKDVEELGETSQDGAKDESFLEGYEEEQNVTEGKDANAESKNEAEQDPTVEQDEAKEPSAQEDPTDDSPQNLKKLQRVSLYKKGLKLREEDDKVDEALQSFLAAITGLTESEAFTDLPLCLHEISNIYFEKNEYEKAVHFIQAEKMYYETALIDIVNLQKELEIKREEKGDEGSEDVERLKTEGPDSPEVIKAKEYEDLAKLCLKESKPQLALEYCGKATKAYRELYGDDHPITVGSLDLFTMIYADVGKKLYTDAMEKFGVEEKDLKAKAADKSEVEGSAEVLAAGEETTNELRQRHKPETQQPASASSAEAVNPTEQSAETEFEPAPPPQEQDDWVTTCLLMLLFFLITVLVILVMSYFYCKDNERSSLCHDLKGDLSYWYMKIKHYYLGSGRR
ncbi:titin homolog [Asterias rubens]|uniref:titin homolog n=1 Tax=Asterias rubens TaxID=7604 RepID=UPI0014553CF0|nr:titin homolog [Asterias rubens]XP_033633613.1 titin homolog [Asterias rubens]